MNHVVGRVRHPGLVDDRVNYPPQDRAQVCHRTDRITIVCLTLIVTDPSQVRIAGGRIFEHKTMQVNYTSYDIRREYDIINPKKHADIMTVSTDFDPATGSAESGHPFCYAHVLGIYHADVIQVLPGHEASVHSIEFLWVHWYQYDATYKSGFKYRRLHRLIPMPLQDSQACGFVDPDDVIRGAHIIPAFAHGKIPPPIHIEGEPVVVQPSWQYYHVNL